MDDKEYIMSGYQHQAKLSREVKKKFFSVCIDDFFSNTYSVEVEAENESQASQVALEKIYSNSHTENFDDLNLWGCEEIQKVSQ